ncbi:MAG: nucleotide exchange factor GrpE [Polyangiaceae bacterium]|jgi:molecular chaperone GrpE|nr:nucleotide exchange factor GrpE [Polyangiaceae bacterium]
MREDEKQEGTASEPVEAGAVNVVEELRGSATEQVGGDRESARARGEPVGDAAQGVAESKAREGLVDAELEEAAAERAERGEEAQVEAEGGAPDPVEVARAESARLREQMLRIAADFDNFRKRARRETEDSARRAREELLRDLLPVFDNMERATLHAEQAQDALAVAEGVKMVVKQFQGTLSRLGVQRVKAVGEVFDPNVHEAIQQVETSDCDAGHVAAEVLPGYLWGERLLRAAMVVVAKAPAAVCAADAGSGGSSEEGQ